MAKQAVKEKTKDSTRSTPEERARRKRAWQDAVKVLKAGTIRTGIPDLGREHEHYLYGRPKQHARD